jgi:UDP-GlcNAc3NAcA epimerase
MKILSIIGARPQFIKAAMISRAISKYNHDSLPRMIQEITVHTGQHYDTNMSDLFFEELDLHEPHYHLGIGGGSHGVMTGRMLEKIEEVILQENPQIVLVYGDTNSTLAGALAAVKLHVPVAHVEAGLRSFSMRMPEEINRVLTDHASQMLFAPTVEAAKNLRQEGIRQAKIFLVGDVMFDAALYYGDKAEIKSQVLKRLDLGPHEFILATIHRAENTDDPARLQAIFGGLLRLAQEIQVVLPLHPRTRDRVVKGGLWEEIDKGIKVSEPLGYLDMMLLEKNARLIVTDSGGVQKEAFFHRVPCVTLREETEWVELVELGWNRVVPPLSTSGVEAGLRQGLAAGRGGETHPYGDGRAAEKIVEILFNGGNRCVF